MIKMVIIIYNKGVMAMNGGMKSIMTRMMTKIVTMMLIITGSMKKRHDDDKKNKVNRDDADNKWQSAASKIS